MNKTKVKIEGIEYEIDIDAASRLGLVKRVAQDIRHGDVYKTNHQFVVFFSKNYNDAIKLSDQKDGFVIGGLNGNPFALYYADYKDKQEAFDNLFSDPCSNYKYVGNLIDNPELVLTLVKPK